MTHSPGASATSPAGEVLIQDDHATMRFERLYPHPIETVWRAITEPAQLAAWFMNKATYEPVKGGALEMVTGMASFRWTGTVLEWDPPRAFAYEWNLEPRDEVPHGERTVVRWELEAVGDETRLVLTHSNLTPGTALGFAPGTHAFMDRLGAQLGGEPLPNWMQRYGEVKDLYPSWQRNA